MIDITQLLILGVVVALGYFVFNGSRHDPREPPLVISGIPILGHIFGILWYGVDHWGNQAKKHPGQPIISLDMFFTKFYVITSPDLMQAVQRNAKTLSFEPLLFFSAKNISGISNQRTLNLLKERDAGGEGLSSKILHAMTPALSGKALDKMNIQMIQLLRPFIEKLGESSIFDLYEWCKDATIAASTEAAYGPMNPYKDKVIKDGWWDFETGLTMLIANTLPWLTARKAWKGRRRAANAILKYFQDGGHNQASELTTMRLKISIESGFTLEEYSKLEVGTLLGLVSNTIPAMFWCLFDLYYRQKLLDEIREEIQANALIIATDGTYRINLTAIREQCPLLLSTFQEILRTRTNSAPTRLVLKDTLLADEYLLKAGNTVSIVSELVAQRPEVWGETSGVFNERRFMNSGEKKESRRVGGFLTFGLSPTICPGRHFASSEILLLVAMVILRYDISPVGGVWKEPKIAASMVSIMGPIKEKFLVEASARKEYAGIKWGFHVEEGKGQFPLVIG
ncbi:uncharacterized protein N7473_012859 [Penicillium subrubescens]|uniref:uncharacterized protein n=1 Tax=Penicillium subrubescens TaxID=1316194 RepID=UPI002545213B|nr:uncharacterized protein N7473_012859 [Penicillium subrubescens]KAJ5875512.1 hypothetical protein N7473_012859 [Penicillium subrubescens]